MKAQSREDTKKVADARDINRDLVNKLEDLRAEYTVAKAKVKVYVVQHNSCGRIAMKLEPAYQFELRYLF